MVAKDSIEADPTRAKLNNSTTVEKLRLNRMRKTDLLTSNYSQDKSSKNVVSRTF